MNCNDYYDVKQSKLEKNRLEEVRVRDLLQLSDLFAYDDTPSTTGTDENCKDKFCTRVKNKNAASFCTKNPRAKTSKRK